jgi:Predicted dehydrogenases and related proteins
MEQEQDEQTKKGQSGPAIGASSRRDFLKAATLSAASLAAAGVASTAVPTEAEAAELTAAVSAATMGAAKAAFKNASGIPVPVADPNKMVSGPYPKAPYINKGNVRGANDRINVAFVGTGGMGGSHVRHFSDDHQNRNIKILGICDVHKGRAQGNGRYAVSKGAADEASLIVVQDYRKILENKDIDAIVIATPEHWHGQIACHAMEAGKHVYIQKPMTRYLDEAFQVHDTAVRTKKVVQVGSQGCSNAIYHAAGKAIREGKIGATVMGQGSYTRNSPNGEWNYGIDGGLSPENLDWEMWLGSAPSRPWDASAGGARDGEAGKRRDPKALYHRYRKYWDYSAGILGDLMPHKLNPFLIASGKPEYPVRVSCVGTRLGDDRDVHDTVQVTAVFPSNWSMLFVGSTVNEQGIQDVFRGHKATIYFGNDVQIRPERWASEEIEGGPVPLEGPTGEPHQRHEINWLDAIRANDPMKATCNYDLATKVQTIVSLAEMSVRLNRAMLFDEKTRKVSTG